VSVVQRILLVEDDPVSARILAELLERRGAAVSLARDGLTGLRFARRGGFDAVVMDWLLPGLDGFRACSLLARDDRFASLPVFVVTGRFEAGEVERIRRAGATRVFSKGLAPACIADEILERLAASHGGRPEPAS